jgi:hypothetical protein
MKMLIDGRFTSHVEEAQIIGQTISSGTNSIVILDMPTIYATRIDVLVESVGNDVTVDLLIYGASKQIVESVNLGTVTTAAGVGSFVHTGAIGQVASLRLTNNNAPATGAATIVAAFMAARA